MMLFRLTYTRVKAMPLQMGSQKILPHAYIRARLHQTLE